LCRACFDGEYPIELPAGNVIGKHVLEGVGKRAGIGDNARVVAGKAGNDDIEHELEAVMGTERPVPQRS
jgi:amidophosphoribosyltransferase